MIKSESKKISNIEKLVEIIANNVAKLTGKVDGLDKKVDALDKRFDGVDKRLDKVEEGLKDARSDILNLGDRFVSYHTFDSLAKRVKTLEEKKK